MISGSRTSSGRKTTTPKDNDDKLNEWYDSFRNEAGLSVAKSRVYGSVPTSDPGRRVSDGARRRGVAVGLAADD